MRKAIVRFARSVHEPGLRSTPEGSKRCLTACQSRRMPTRPAPSIDASSSDARRASTATCRRARRRPQLLNRAAGRRGASSAHQPAPAARALRRGQSRTSSLARTSSTIADTCRPASARPSQLRRARRAPAPLPACRRQQRRFGLALQRDDVGCGEARAPTAPRSLRGRAPRPCRKRTSSRSRARHEFDGATASSAVDSSSCVGAAAALVTGC